MTTIKVVKISRLILLLGFYAHWIAPIISYFSNPYADKWTNFPFGLLYALPLIIFSSLITILVVFIKALKQKKVEYTEGINKEVKKDIYTHLTICFLFMIEWFLVFYLIFSNYRINMI